MELETLNTLLARDGGRLPARALYMLQQPLVETLIEWRDSDDKHQCGALSEETIAFAPQCKQMSLLAASSNEQENLVSWGKMWLNVITCTGSEKSLKKIATQCSTGEITTLEELHLALERRVNRFIYKLLLVIIIAGLAVMAAVQFS